MQTLSYPCHSIGGSCDAAHTLSLTNTYTNGLLTKVGTPQNTSNWASSITYRPSGIIDTVTHSNGAPEIWTADSMGRPASITVKDAFGATVWASGAYVYDAAGDVAKIGNTTYHHDPFGRLNNWTKTNPDGSYDYVAQIYDTFGNKLQNTYSGCGYVYGVWQCYSNPGPTRAIAGTTNHYTDVSYDAAGRVIADPTSPSRTWVYDVLGNVKKVSDTAIDLRFLYSADDERVAAVQRITGGDGITRNKTTYTLRGFDNRLLSVWTSDPNSGALSWKEDEIWRGAMLLTKEAPAGTMHYGVDHLGSPRGITNAAGHVYGGGVQDFQPFGQGGSTDGGALQFTAQERDATNLGGGSVSLPDYFHARYYDANGSRFLALDPLVDTQRAAHEPQLWNRYGYVENNPVSYVDPSGLWSWNPLDWFRNKDPKRTVSPNGQVGFPCYECAPLVVYGKRPSKAGASAPAKQESLRSRYAGMMRRAAHADFDYMTVNVNVAIPNPLTKTLVGYAFGGTFDRYGRSYPMWRGVGVGKSITGVSGSVTWGVLMSGTPPSRDAVSQFIAGHGGNLAAGSFFGGGITYSPGMPSTVPSFAGEFGLFTPQVGATYSYTSEPLP